MKPSYKQAFQNVPLAIEDCEDVRKFFQREYGVEEEDIFLMYNESLRYCTDVYNHVAQILSDNSDTEFLVFHIMAGHGVQKLGLHTLLLNEFDPEFRFYTRLEIEFYVMQLAEKNPNSYHIAIFASCRAADKEFYFFNSVQHAVNRLTD